MRSPICGLIEKEKVDQDWLIIAIRGTLYYHIVGQTPLVWHKHPRPVPGVPQRVPVMNSVAMYSNSQYRVYLSSDENGYMNDTIYIWNTGHGRFQVVPYANLESRVGLQ